MISRYLPLIVTVIFLSVSLLTLGGYNHSWDETIHFRRGQAYLHYFLTGQKNYSDLPIVQFQGTKGDPQKIPTPRRSIYQNDYHTAEHFFQVDRGHPPLNDLISASSNYVFFQKLGWLSDLDAHHLFNVFASALLVFVVASFSLKTFGPAASIISSLSLITYPLFFAESHFNIKDPPLAAFFAATIWAFYLSLEKYSWKWLILSVIFFALALGTKFNILFLPLIIVPYLIFRYKGLVKKDRKQNIPRSYLLGLLFAPFIVVTIFVLSWPALWHNSFVNFLKVVQFYQQIGSGTNYQPDNFYVLGFNIFPLLWIIYTTPPLTLFLSLIGIYCSIKNRHKFNGVSLLWLLWLLVPILRVTVPGASVYGGIRQIMEFLPAMALISGLAGWQIIQWTRNKYTPLIIILLFLWPVFVLIKMHPYQNVYFNSLIGGLPGAKAQNFPSWGNSLGTPYLEGVKWINQYAEPGAKLTLIQGTPSNAPIESLRSDIQYLVGGDINSSQTFFSGTDKSGEYIMELTFNDTGKDFHEIWDYTEKNLQTVYEVKVDGVSILKIWKNDLAHSKLNTL